MTKKIFKTSAISTTTNNSKDDSNALIMITSTQCEIQLTTTNTNNIMAIYRQNPVGMFMGANLHNCTININMPK